MGLAEFLFESPKEKKPLSPRGAKIFRIVEIASVILVVCLVVVLLYNIIGNGGSVRVRVNCEGWTSAASKTTLAIYNYDAVSDLTDDDPSNDPSPKVSIPITPNEDKTLTEIISTGTYTLRVDTLPVLEDGTTFKEPDPLAVTYEGDDEEVVFTLEKQE